MSCLRSYKYRCAVKLFALKPAFIYIVEEIAVYGFGVYAKIASDGSVVFTELPQTGQLYWPIPVLLSAGVVLRVVTDEPKEYYTPVKGSVSLEDVYLYYFEYIKTM